MPEDPEGREQPPDSAQPFPQEQELPTGAGLTEMGPGTGAASLNWDGMAVALGEGQAAQNSLILGLLQDTDLSGAAALRVQSGSG